VVMVVGKAVRLVVRVVGSAVCLVGVVVDSTGLVWSMPPTPRPHSPKFAWHPEPQSASVPPHFPLRVQQLPYADPRQEYWLAEPQVPSGETSS
jgi:hypothetical protein